MRNTAIVEGAKSCMVGSSVEYRRSGSSSTGAPFQWAAIFHKADMYFTKGASGLTFYNSAHQSREYETPTKVCCSFCRSPIMDEGRRMCLVFPESIDFGDAPEEKMEWRKAFEVR